MHGELISAVGEDAFLIITLGIVVLFVICTCLSLIADVYDDKTGEDDNDV
jgi:hypothetical protein